mmetsp:Transcript_35491/g.66098  ORF Transcript_35491/g.66098 Transcript_35491/m.66098 type:complete len:205 (-) Transcript_35491:138-752(-)
MMSGQLGSFMSQPPRGTGRKLFASKMNLLSGIVLHPISYCRGFFLKESTGGVFITSPAKRMLCNDSDFDRIGACVRPTRKPFLRYTSRLTCEQLAALSDVSDHSRRASGASRIGASPVQLSMRRCRFSAMRSADCRKVTSCAQNFLSRSTAAFAGASASLAGAGCLCCGARGSGSGGGRLMASGSHRLSATRFLKIVSDGCIFS